MIQQTTTTSQPTSGACVVCHHPTDHYDWCMLAGQDMNETDPAETDCQQDGEQAGPAAGIADALAEFYASPEYRAEVIQGRAPEREV